DPGPVSGIAGAAPAWRLSRHRVTIHSVTTTPTQPASGQHAPAGHRGMPRYVRRSDGRLLGGVASGLAVHLNLQVLTVRAGCALLTALAVCGVARYVARWVCAPRDEAGAREAEEGAPAGVAAATRSGKRVRRPLVARTGDIGQLVALVLLGAGVVGLAQLT